MKTRTRPLPHCVERLECRVSPSVAFRAVPMGRVRSAVELYAREFARIKSDNPDKVTKDPATGREVVRLDGDQLIRLLVLACIPIGLFWAGEIELETPTPPIGTMFDRQEYGDSVYMELASGGYTDVEIHEWADRLFEFFDTLFPAPQAVTAVKNFTEEPEETIAV